MKKLLFFILLFFAGVVSAFAQAPTHEQLTYQTVVRNAQNQLVIDQAGITVKVYVCSDAAGSNVVYSETHTGLSTNANGMLSMMIGSVAPDVGTWAGINWSEAYIKTTISYGSVTINSDPAPVTAVPYALQAGNSSNITNIISDAIHDSITNNISAQIHDSIVNNINNNISTQIHDSLTNALSGLEIQNCADVNNCVANAIADGTSAINQAIDTVATNVTNNILTDNHYVTETIMGSAIHDSIPTNVSAFANDANYVSTTNLCTTIETNCDNVALKNGNNAFTGTNTVPSGFDIHSTDASSCNNVVVNACDLFAVFDSLNTRFNAVYDSLARLAQALEDLMNSVPPTANAPTMSDVSSNAMTATANAVSTGANITSYEFCISTSSDMSGATCQTVQASDADNYTFTGLTPNTSYYVQYKATNFAGTTPSPVVQQRTPAHAPTAIVVEPLTSTKPAGFKVEVTDIDPKEKTDATTVQVCYKKKTGATCPEKESAEYADCKTVNGASDTVISVTGLEELTDYCAIVKVSNGDSTTIYGPFTATTGADVVMTINGPSDTNRCGAATVDVPYFVTVTGAGADANDFTYEWSAGTSTTGMDTVSLSATSTITVTATHTTEHYTLTATKTTTVNNNPINLAMCENDGVVSLRFVNGTSSINWGDGQTTSPINTSTTHDYVALGNGSHEVTLTSSNSYGCAYSRTMTVIIAATAADRTVKPCTAASMGSRWAQTSSTFTGNGFGGANYGLETVNGDGAITSVTDYDGNAYPVVQIGSQCWLAENLRCKHSPKTGSDLVGTTIYENNGSKLALWYSNAEATYKPKRYGLLYNWCAAMDTAKPSDGSYTYVEVAASNNTSNDFDFTPSGNHQGICPLGWHLPTDAEWNTMEAEVSGSDWQSSYETGGGYDRGSHAGKLAGSCNWTATDNAKSAGDYRNAERNASGFYAMPAGFFNASSFNEVGTLALFRTASQQAWIRIMSSYYAGVTRATNTKYSGFSVRCVRDTVALIVTASSNTVKLCGGTTAEAVFTATPSSGDASDYTYTWSTGATASGNTATYSLAAGTHTVYVTATHAIEGYTLTAAATTTVSNSGTAPTIAFCVDDENYSVSVKVAANVSSVTWGDGQSTDEPITTSTAPHEYTHSPATYNVTAYSNDGCLVEKKVSLGGHNPYSCTVATAHTDGSTYTSTTGGLETVNGEGKVVSVQDQDGHTYAVTQIENYCLIRTNLRTSKYRSETGTDNDIVDGGNYFSRTSPYYYKPTPSSSWSTSYGVTYDMYNDSIFGYYYNWAAAAREDICPKGWHVPDREEWRQILVVAGDGAVNLTGGCLWYNTSSSGTYPNNYGHSDRDRWGFSIIPAGNRGNSSFSDAGSFSGFWSRTAEGASSALRWSFSITHGDVYEYLNLKEDGFSVRCVRD